MKTWSCLVSFFVFTSLAWAQAGDQVPPPDTPATTEAPKAEVAPPGDEPPKPAEDIPAPKPAETKVASVTVYQGNALVTREVAVPKGKGVTEVVVTPLPAQTVESSLYTEGTDGLRVLSTRYRTRAVKEDTRKEVRAKEQEIKTLQAEGQRMEREIQTLKQNLEFLQKLENFTGATMQGLAEKGMLNGEATITLSKYVMSTRTEKSTASVALEQQLQANKEAIEFAQRQLQEVSAGSSRVEIDAVIVVDKADAAGTVRLNYLVGASTWNPMYRFRAGGDKDPVSLEYLAAIEQQSGEDWKDAQITLSTAQPSLNATVPDLLPLDIAVIGRGQPGQPSGGKPQSGMMGGGMGGMGGSMGGMGLSIEQQRAQARDYRGRANQEMIGNNAKAGGALLNEAAALDQAEELLAKDDDEKKAGGGPGDGPSVTYHLKGALNIPSRRDPQLVEVARVEMEPDYFDKAVPVLSPRVYRLARLTNKAPSVLLPGEATMYVGTDFVGRMTLPQVAVGEQFTVGFGVDPQLQVGRRLVKKSQAVQGGNQVHNYEFQIVVRNFGSNPVKLQLWDRLPRAESEAVAVSMSDVKPDLSDDALYKRVQKPDNLLRWDLVAQPGTTGEKAMMVTYDFKLEYAREVSINYFKTGGMMEAPIGGMGGMGGGFR